MRRLGGDDGGCCDSIIVSYLLKITGTSWLQVRHAKVIVKAATVGDERILTRG